MITYGGGAPAPQNTKPAAQGGSKKPAKKKKT